MKTALRPLVLNALGRHVENAQGRMAPWHLGAGEQRPGDGPGGRGRGRVCCVARWPGGWRLRRPAKEPQRQHTSSEVFPSVTRDLCSRPRWLPRGDSTAGQTLQPVSHPTLRGTLPGGIGGPCLQGRCLANRRVSSNSLGGGALQQPRGL